MTTPVFPYLAGVGWPATRSPGNFDTTTQVAMSGKETRFANRTQARYKYELAIEALDSSGFNAGLVAYSKQALEGFFNQCLGGALIFNYWDVDDFQATAQEFGVGDGVTTAFQLARASGGWVDLIFAPLNSPSQEQLLLADGTDPVLLADGTDPLLLAGSGAGSVQVPSPSGGLMNAPYPTPQISIAGVLQTSGYTVGATGLVTFTSAPTSGAALSWTGNYYWPCNFDADTIALAKFMGGLWEAKSIKFTTRIF